MPTTVAMPRLSDSMEEGTVVRWLVEEGGVVGRGDELAEIETDKATMAFEADSAGRLHRLVLEGESVAVGVAIAELLGEGEEPSGVGGGEAEAGGEAEGGADEAGDAGGGGDEDGDAEGEAGDAEGEAGDAEGEAGDAEGEAGDAEGEARGGETGGGSSGAAGGGAEGVGGRVKASPLARRVAREAGVDLAGLAGSGPGGRIVRADVEAAVERGAAGPAAGSGGASRAPAPVDSTEGARGSVEVVDPTRVQQVIARRMSESKATIPDFQVRVEADVTELLELRAMLKAHGRVASVNDFVVKACALALVDHPKANGAFVDGKFQLHGRVNIGVAVAGEGTLVVPTVFDADRKPVTEIAADTRALAAKVRDNAISPPELAGGTFTVSNLGMLGITSFTAVVNPGQAAILAVGAAVTRPVYDDDGQLAPRSLMDLSLSCDHRILYGAQAAEFLARVRDLLQTPYTLIS